MPWLAGMLSGVLVGIAKTLFTEEVIKRVIVDLVWFAASKESNDLSFKLANTVAKSLNYGYKPELDK